MNRAQYVVALESLAASKPPIPYRHAGRDRHGLDCIGALVLPLIEAGVPFTDRRQYKRMASGDSLVDAIAGQFVLHASGAGCWREARDGDWVLMWWDRHTRVPQHAAAVVSGGEQLVHAYESGGYVVRSAFIDKWRSRCTHVFRLPMISDVP